MVPNSLLKRQNKAFFFHFNVQKYVFIDDLLYHYEWALLQISEFNNFVHIVKIQWKELFLWLFMLPLILISSQGRREKLAPETEGGKYWWKLRFFVKPLKKGPRGGRRNVAPPPLYTPTIVVFLIAISYIPYVLKLCISFFLFKCVKCLIHKKKTLRNNCNKGFFDFFPIVNLYIYCIKIVKRKCAKISLSSRNLEAICNSWWPSFLHITYDQIIFDSESIHKVKSSSSDFEQLSYSPFE